jgi:hypothetical protein
MFGHYQMFLRFGSKDGRTRFICGYDDLQTANHAALLLFNNVVAVLSAGAEGAPEEDICETDGTKSFSLKGMFPMTDPSGLLLSTLVPVKTSS